MSVIECANSKRRIARVNGLRSFKLVINQWMIFPDADQQNKFILYLEYIAITPK